MRNLWVDYAKGVGIVLVVYGHVASGLFNAGIALDGDRFRLVNSIIYSFHMPLFFFLSGLFFYDSLAKRGGGMLVANKVDTIVYPYLVWSLLQGMIEVCMSRWTNGNIGLSEVLSLLWSPRAQFWFLYALFVISLFAVSICSNSSRRYLALWPLLCAASYFLPVNSFGIKPLSYLLNYTVYFMLGIYFNEIQHIVYRHCSKVLPLALLLFLAAQYMFHGYLGLTWEARGPASLALAVTSILAICLACMALASSTPLLRWLAFLGNSSMTIFLMHTLIASGVRITLKSALHIQAPIPHLILGCLSGVLLPLLIYHYGRQCGVDALLRAPHALSAERRVRQARK